MSGGRSIDMKSVRAYSLRKKIGGGLPGGAPFVKKFWNQNDVEFDFSIGHALVLFPFFWK